MDGGDGVIVPAQSTLTQVDNLAITLPRYFQIIQVTECSGMGVNDPDNPEPGCRDIWTKFQRDEVERYLAEAQEEIEQQIHYTLTRRWFTDETHQWRNPLQTNWGKVIEGGIKATSNIALAQAVSHATDPAIIGPVATTVTDANEIHVFHPGLDVEIIPSKITLSGGNVTIQIPRCRMVKEAVADNPESGLDYSDLSNFESTVDIKRIYNDPSTNAVIVWPHHCNASCAAGGCSEYTRNGCIYVRMPDIGSVDVTPATYSDGAWSTLVSGSACCPGTPQYVRLNYRAGVTATRQMEDAIVRLAHSKMPDEFCGCEVWQRLWRRDRHVPEILTRERLNCPYGSNEGAWIAWSFTRQFKLVRGFTM